MTVDVKIGITDSPRELVVQTDQSSDAVHALVETALAGGESLLRLTDEKGARFLVPVTKIAYVEVGTSERPKVGFGAG
ncbi:DUF3107 domain-containing protein [Williamsia sp. CHRR-6]|uniref:DUF3107 domain-containing protein n=1 Tax=Williamsia sp. CHRR-6 TaxID=2835871 RepID=UPI001BDA353D|nr:DUF3107 domain-containing protein [Williamsia sp. CHRR-6]MBT0565656.1 DUF3107 domain-containing protein [Williamsia sp. CHRR-6]